ncbi:hypothetical protein IAC76_08650 [Spirochaetes bacterium]|uniref:Uncharacterized protein n=1 Tax=Candidatus Scatousia excrementipullorum TaxID=2840936 RepID=A0A9D9DQ18_9BACT|nr:hypothetical protein [Candidatus Scatousia excrementipullorum]
MRKILTSLIIIVLASNCCGFAMAKDISAKDNETLPHIFIWHLPDDEDNNSTANNTSEKNEPEEDIIYTAAPEEIPLKGYAEYEDNSEAIYLTDNDNNFVLNLRIPQKFESKRLVDSKEMKNYKTYSLFNSEEYNIQPKSVASVQKTGNFSYGTLFNSGIDNAQLERSTTLFTRYEKKKFAINSAYKKNNLTTYGLNTDNFYIAPELKFNDIFSLSEILSTDITRNRRKGEIILSVSPLKDDRMKFEIGAGTTYDINNDRSWSQVKFNTQFKL